MIISFIWGRLNLHRWPKGLSSQNLLFLQCNWLLLPQKSGICVLFHPVWMGHDFGGCYVTFEARWEMIIALLVCYEILLEHGHGTTTKKFKLAHAGTSYREVTCISSSQQLSWAPHQARINHGQPSSWYDPIHWVPYPIPAFLPSLLRLSHQRAERSHLCCEVQTSGARTVNIVKCWFMPLTF